MFSRGRTQERRTGRGPVIPDNHPSIVVEVEPGLRAVIPPEGQVLGEDIRVGDTVAGILRQVSYCAFLTRKHFLADRIPSG
jgi:hypothetical protein